MIDPDFEELYTTSSEVDDDELIKVHHNKIALDKLQDDLQAVFDGTTEQVTAIINEFLVGNMPWLSGEQED
jgi:N-methylhydantoinase B/oxoprolinase/acetone carboxylase alpha subunit